MCFGVLWVGVNGIAFRVAHRIPAGSGWRSFLMCPACPRQEDKRLPRILGVYTPRGAARHRDVVNGERGETCMTCHLLQHVIFVCALGTAASRKVDR